MRKFQLQVTDNQLFVVSEKGEKRKLSPRESLPVFKEMAAQGTFHFQGKQLIVDLFGTMELFFRIENDLPVPYLQKGDTLFPLQSCDFVSREWFIKGTLLRRIKPDVPLSFDLKDLQGEYRIEGHLQKREAFPELQLTDRTGAFANLHLHGHVHDPDALKMWEKDLLETAFIRKPVGNSTYYCPLDQVGKSLTFLLEIGWHIVDVRGNKLHLCTSRTLKMDEQRVVRGTYRFEEFEADVTQVVGQFNKRERFLTLAEGHIGWLGDIPPELAEGEIVTEGVRVKRQAAMTLEDVDIPPVYKALKVPQATPPTSRFQGTLRPYQQIGLHWLLALDQAHFSGLLADDMGLGKTVQVLAWLSHLEPEDPVLIVAPTSLLFNWKREIVKFLPDAKGIVLASYTQVRLHSYEETHWRALICDEAQAIKNAATKTAQALCRLKAETRLSITGTPVENHLVELWNHFHFLMPDLLGSSATFEAAVKAAESDSHHLQRIKKQVRPFILRRRKEEVALELPPRQDQEILVEMTPAQRTFYEQFLAQARHGLLQKVSLDGAQKHRMEILETLLRLRQICCHPWLVDTQGPNESGKLNQVLEDLAILAEEGRKTLIYSQFTTHLHLLAKYLTAPYVLLEGSTSNRAQVVDTFQNDPTIPFFLISLKAGGTGLNLTAADTVMLLDPWWNNAVEEQAIARIHRLGQDKAIFARRYLTIESIEEKIFSLKKRKTDLSDSLLEESDTPLLSDEDWMSVFS